MEELNATLPSHVHGTMSRVGGGGIRLCGLGEIVVVRHSSCLSMEWSRHSKDGQPVREWDIPFFGSMGERGWDIPFFGSMGGKGMGHTLFWRF